MESVKTAGMDRNSEAAESGPYEAITYTGMILKVGLLFLGGCLKSVGCLVSEMRYKC